MSYNQSAFAKPDARPSGTRSLDMRSALKKLAASIQETAYGCAWAMKSPRVGCLPYIWRAGLLHYLTPKSKRPGPNVEIALNRGEGFVGICDELTPEIVLSTYAQGLYAFNHVSPMKWWSPPQRSVLFFDETHLEKNLRRLLRRKKFSVTFDHSFGRVIEACAAPRPGRRHLTWINDAQMSCFKTLHRMGHAHSVEVWDQDGNLAGGLYGLAIGGVFLTESQFFTQRDASKVGFAVLNQHLQHWGFAANDGKNETPHLKQTGFTNIARSKFREILRNHSESPVEPGRWNVSPDLDVTGWIPSDSPGLTRQQVL